jgi:hypothetical protein
LSDRDIAPAQDFLSDIFDVPPDDRFHRLAWFPFLRKEYHAHGVLAGGRQFEIDIGTQEGVRHLHEDARAVAGLRVCADRAPMMQTLEQFKALGYDAMALLVPDVAYEADTAGVSLEFRVVHALRGGEGANAHGWTSWLPGCYWTLEPASRSSRPIDRDERVRTPAVAAP